MLTQEIMLAPLSQSGSNDLASLPRSMALHREPLTAVCFPGLQHRARREEGQRLAGWRCPLLTGLLRTSAGGPHLWGQPALFSRPWLPSPPLGWADGSAAPASPMQPGKS